MKKKETKKQVRQSAVINLIFGLILLFGMFGLFYWDYREQVKFFNVWERGTGLDFKTGKVDPNFQPKPFQYRYDRMFYLPYIVISGSVSLLFLLVAVSDFRKSSKMIETTEMLRADAQQDKYENSPEVKTRVRQNLILRLLPFLVQIPVPFIAIYGFGAVVFVI
jgi:hypothetical protein